MPLRQFRCSICGKNAPKKLLEHSQFSNRMAWLRRHRKAKHPEAFRKSTKKGAATRKRR